jgi:hypothetical protein
MLLSTSACSVPIHLETHANSDHLCLRHRDCCVTDSVSSKLMSIVPRYSLPYKVLLAVSFQLAMSFCGPHTEIVALVDCLPQHRKTYPT